MYYAVIMAGGTGTRLWPLSRQAHPKQTLKLIGDRSMFQLAVDRLRPLFEVDQIQIVTREEHAASLSEQVPELPRENFIIEPVGRGTAPAIGLAAIHLRHHDPDAVMAVLTADHHIAKTQRFRDVLAAAEQLALQGHLVTLGITPTFPSTGYGYIMQGEALEEVNGFAGYHVKLFTEKPDQSTANDMFECGCFSWNSGMFVWRADRVLQEFERQMPLFYDKLCEIEQAADSPQYRDVLNRLWLEEGKQTIDYGVMEHAEDVVVLPVDIGWTDVGSWGSLPDLLPADDKGNTVVGRHLSIDTSDTLIFNTNGDRMIATIGVEDLVIVATPDSVLVCSKDREQDVKAIVEQLESEEGLSEWL
jgi:mannose-1-phosphate guanylyltransferase